MSGWDCIVVGAGHNGLATALLLAKAGKRTLVLEAAAEPGGLCAGASFHPGYRHVGIHHDSGSLRPWAVEALGLAEHGLTWRDSSEAWIAGSTARRCTPPESLARALDAIRPAALAILDEPAPRIDAEASALPLVKHAVRLRRLGAMPMMDLMRTGALTAEDWLSEHTDDAELRAALALPALIGTWMGPRSPHSAAQVLLHGVRRGKAVQGGPAALVSALVAGCAAAGVEVRTSAPVERIRIERGAVAGVEVEDGEAIDAAAVVCATDPRTALLDLVSPLDIPPEVEDQASQHRVRATSSKVHLALSGALELPGADGPVERLQIAGGPNDVERAFDAAKHGRLVERPALEIAVPSVHTQGLAPEGHHVASLHVFGTGYEVNGGWEAQREPLLEAVLDQLEAACPGTRAKVVGAEVLTPPDLARRYRLAGGHLTHGEHALDRLWFGRPGPLLSRHTTPVAGLVLCSGGTHPGGGVSAANGVFAARALLRHGT